MRRQISVVKKLLLVATLFLITPWLITLMWYHQRIYPAYHSHLKSQAVALVFGAGLRHNQPSPILSNRVTTAVQLYHDGIVSHLIMSGDGLKDDYYSEPVAMRKLAVKLGVPEPAILLDFAGNNTYSSCLRAKQEFGITSVILVTQPFHLPRALFICNHLGVNSIGVSSSAIFAHKKNLSYFAMLAYWNGREILATAKAWWRIYISPWLADNLRLSI